MDDTTTGALNRLHALVLSYAQANRSVDTSAVRHLTAEALRERIDVSLPEQGEGEASLADWVDQYLEFSVRTGGRRYFNQLWGGFSLPGFMGEVTTALSNTSMYTYEVAPVATLIEQELIAKLGALVGFEEGEGLFVTGGSNANTIAMMAARHRVCPDFKWGGADGRRLLLYVSDQAHYSFCKAANLMGLGLNQVIEVASDGQGRMRPDALREALASGREEGGQSFFVAATAGTTVLGAFDPLSDIADVCEAEGIWFHVDGAWGGSVAMSDSLRHHIAGSHRADSFTWDQHKMMGMPLICSSILFRERGILHQLNHVGGSDYLFHEAGDPSMDLGPISLQCGRRVDALKLWLAWKCFGRVGFAHKIEHIFELAQHVARWLDAHPRFVRVAPVASLNICFRYEPEGVTNEGVIDRVNMSARDALAKSGVALVNHAQWQGRSIWRLVVAGFDLTVQDMDRLMTEIEGACQEAARG
jgi:glutamate/tyrosine decarboxylase-like PLP-dependent enzyme